MARLRLDVSKKNTFTWKSPIGHIREGCVVMKNLYNDFIYKIKDGEGRVWLAYPSELTQENVEEVK